MTATIGGDPPAPDAEAAGDALVVAAAVALELAVPPEDPPHAASTAMAAGTASLPSRTRPGAREAEEAADIT
ncbi:MAG TPA: hypothetical protein VFX25_17735 [Streptosporangiaceae bacterium]|nr:hypothetical protein [Streptosporangiaceae bacterium]